MERTIEFELKLDSPIEEVWQAWTTAEGITSFFAPACNLDLRPGGAYEIFFNPDEPPGQRGGDDMILLALQPPHLLSFTWNAPLSLPDVRPHRTHVTLRLEGRNGNGTRLHFREDGFGQGGQWDERVEYFVRAWGQIVLPRLAYRLDQGPVDWDEFDVKHLEPYQPLVKRL